MVRKPFQPRVLLFRSHRACRWLTRADVWYRYAHIEAKTDTGPNMRKIEERFGITSARYKRTEVFRRIKPSNLAAELRAGNVQDVLVLDLREKDEFDAFHIRVSHLHPHTLGCCRACCRIASEHVGGMLANGAAPVQDAHNYPASMMSRSMYHFTPEILQFKNKEGKLMVLYDIGIRALLTDVLFV